MLWFKYGVYLGDAALIIVNGVGAITSLVSLIVYYVYTGEKPDVEKRLLQLLLGLAFLFSIVRLGWIDPRWVGLVAMVASVTMFASPLVALVTGLMSSLLTHS